MQRSAPKYKLGVRLDTSRARALSADSAASIPAPTGGGMILGGPVDSPAISLVSDLLGPVRPGFSGKRDASNISRMMTNNELLDEIEHQRAFNNSILDEQNDEDLPDRYWLPWHRRPSPWWLIIGTFLAAIAISTTIAPKVELLTKLVCRELGSEYDMLITIPRPSKACQKDSGVQKAVARLGATISTLMGVLSCFTGGYWGQFSDRYGRTLVLAVTVSGVLLTDLTLILVTHLGHKLPFGYRFILIAPIMEGLLGGIAAGAAAGHAYIADCTNPATRSRYLSLSMGLLFVGIAIGPTIGGLLISRTGDLLSVYYLAASIHLLYLLSMLFIVPESLSKEEMSSNRETHAEKIKRDQEMEQRGGSGFWYWCWTYIKRAFFFLKPLAIFSPRKRAGGLKSRNWNFIYLMVAYSSTALILGGSQYTFQYALYTFGWTSQQLGYWLSTFAVLRATHLVVILPLMMKLCNRQSITTPGGGTPNTPISETSSIATSIGSDPNRSLQVPTFDLLVARVSAVIEVLGYAGAALSTTPELWIAATLFSSLGGGIAPSTQALALELQREREEEEEETLDGGEVNHSQQRSVSASSSGLNGAAGRKVTASSVGEIYGAMAVLQALCSQILGPQISGWTFVATIQAWPKAIFWLSAGMFAAALIALLLIRLSDPQAVDEESPTGVNSAEREPLLLAEGAGMSHQVEETGS